jgi:catechol 2,3-dioxygenase-like lactoylglutathione lyase family enzyme
MIERIGHINIRTPLLEETLRFYERLVSLRRGDALTMTDQANNAWLFDDSGRAVVHVNKCMEGESIPDVGAPNRLNHVAFDIRDLDVMEARLKDMQLPYQKFPIESCPGLTLLVTRDPNGITLELAHGTQVVRRMDMAQH